MTNDPTNLTPDTTQNAVASTMPLPANFRWRAFGIHLAISLAILAVLLWILFTRWFPDYLFDTDGGWQALRVIAGVDIVLGPLLTLIVANAAKPRRELRRDFTIIGLIQASALTFGTWLAWDNRPYAMLWYDGMVYSMPYSAFGHVPEARAHIAGLERTDGPPLIYVELPLDPLERDPVLRLGLAHGSALFISGLYRNWPPPTELLRDHQTLALGKIRDRATRDRLAAAATVPNQILIPTKSRYQNYFLVMDDTSGRIIDQMPREP